MKETKLIRSNEPLTFNIPIDEFTDITKEIFDYEFTGNGEYYPWYINKEMFGKYNIGFIIGSSGSGKSTLLKSILENGSTSFYKWNKNNAVVSQFDNPGDAIDRLTSCGFNSIPDWVKPYEILSTGQKFRVDVAKILNDNVAIDEFTSVVDRDTAKSTSNTISKYIKKRNFKNIILVSGHSDIIPYLKPDWIINTDLGIFYSDIDDYSNISNFCVNIDKTKFNEKIGEFYSDTVKLDVFKVPNYLKNDIWNIFGKHHYLISTLNLSAHAFVCFWEEKIVGFSAVLCQPGNIPNMWREHRLVILPQFQGLGIGTRLSDFIAEYYLSQGKRFISKSAHPRLGEYRTNSLLWRETSTNKKKPKKPENIQNFNKIKIDYDRTCYSFEYVGLTPILYDNKKNDRKQAEADCLYNLITKQIIFANPLRLYTIEQDINLGHIKRLYKKTQHHVKNHTLVPDEIVEYCNSQLKKLENGKIVRIDIEKVLLSFKNNIDLIF